MRVSTLCQAASGRAGERARGPATREQGALAVDPGASTRVLVDDKVENGEDDRENGVGGACDGADDAGALGRRRCVDCARRRARPVSAPATRVSAPPVRCRRACAPHKQTHGPACRHVNGMGTPTSAAPGRGAVRVGSEGRPHAVAAMVRARALSAARGAAQGQGSTGGRPGREGGGGRIALVRAHTAHAHRTHTSYERATQLFFLLFLPTTATSGSRVTGRAPRSRRAHAQPSRRCSTFRAS